MICLLWIVAGGDGLGELGQKKKKVKANITTKIFTSLKGAAGQPLDLEGEGRGRSGAPGASAPVNITIIYNNDNSY